MRGKHAHAFRTAEHTRLIPASAGKTAWVLRPRNPGTAHPSVCRESATAWTEEDCAHDSSPRVRGKQINLQVQAPCPGLIPACAGKTRRLLAWLPASWAHPRVCGENAPSTTATKAAHGSSPRVRGKQRRSRRRRGGPGLIPACAGKTCHQHLGRSRARAHPRVCGENLGIESRLRIFCGSSPRVRGKLSETPYRSIGSRLIPACAGKTATKSRSPARCQAHPRVCGENSNLRCLIFVESGSSPRVRGKLHRPTRKGQTPGLIPACAGKT